MEHQEPLILLVREILHVAATRLPESGKYIMPPPPLLQPSPRQVKRGQVIRLVQHGREEINRIETIQQRLTSVKPELCLGELLVGTGRI